MARDSTESRFLEVLHRFGGPQRVQLVGELWDRAESRALLEGFLRDIFPAELPPGADILRSKAAQQGSEKGHLCEGSPGRGGEKAPLCEGSPEHGENGAGPRCEGSPEHGENGAGPRCEGSPEHGGNGAGPRCEGNPERGGEKDPQRGAQPAVPTRPAPQPKPERTLRFGLVFFLCRAETLRLRGASRQLREILRDVRERMPAGGAVIGVIMKTKSEVNGQEIGVLCEDGGSEVSSLLAILQAVFPEKSRGKLCSEVRACVLLPGQEESRREIQRLACEALTAADELRKVKPKMKSQCFSWRRRRWKDCVEKEFVQEGTALTVLQYPNGDCTETTDA
ncbi:uncharacterized protein C2orf72 homolog isoform X1 [Rana temporaria]|uniref:uncharacterized protein C2orf72 homolog isoform X1 n=1 Tax=Rana temporaria TaxID=8407 RepID=UPI001AADC830|nr:uncharacterized protein C2orf72 homolog isoform X1 [Rana temporaria]